MSPKHLFFPIIYLFYFLIVNNVFAAELQLLSGDMLKIRITNQPELDQECRVTISGEIKVLGAGKFSVINKSDDELEKEITKGFIDESSLTDPEVFIQVSITTPRKIYVHGHVVKNQSVEMNYGQNLSLTQLVAEVGGFKDGADLQAIMVTRRINQFDSKKVQHIFVDFHQLINMKNVEPFILQPSDVVFVKELDDVLLTGAVQTPGVIKLKSGSEMSCEKAVSLAGGFVENSQKAFYSLKRNGRTFIMPFSASDQNKLKYAEELFSGLKPGDIVEILSLEQVYLDGFIKNPGPYYVDQDKPLSLRKLISIAGGAKEEAKLERIKVLREDTNGPEVFTVDVSKLKHGRKNEVFLVRPGDYIYLPRSFF